MNTPRSGSTSQQFDNKKPLRIDGHAHVFLASLPMARGRRYTPGYDATPQNFFDLLEKQGLGGALLIQPSFFGTDNSYLLDVLTTTRCLPSAPRLWGVAVLEPSTSADKMRVLKESGIVGVRLNFFSHPLPDLASPLWANYLARVEALGWHVEVHIEGPRLPALLDRLGGTISHLVIDHFGLPEAAAPTRCSGFLDLLSDRHPGICVKLSAPYRVFPLLPLDVAEQQCGQLARLLLNSIGPERLIWGSDFPWTQHEREKTFTTCMQWGNNWFSGVDATPGLAPDWLAGVS